MIQAVALCEQAGTAVLRGFDIDEDSDQSIAEQLRGALSATGARVIDLFREWDTDGDGKVTRAEFHRAMGLLRFSAPKAEIDVVFSSWDPDGSGVLEVKELERLLLQRKGSTTLDAAGEAEARARARGGATAQAAAQAKAAEAKRVARAAAGPEEGEGGESTPRASSDAPPPPPPLPPPIPLPPRSPRQRHIEAVYTQLEQARRQDARLAHLIVPHVPPAWAWKTERQAEARPVLATVRPSTVQAGQSPECPAAATANVVPGGY